MSKVKGQRSKVRGQSIIEVIVAVAIFIIIAGSSVVTVLGAFLTTQLAEDETRAVALASEGLEAVASIRNKSWEELVDGDHGLTNLNDTWEFQGSSETIEKFTRKINISSVQRNENGEIAANGIVVDPDTKKVTAEISWTISATRINTIQIASYMTNWQEAERVTSCLDFCLIRGYLNGTCRRNSQTCLSNDEVYQSSADLYCTGGSSVDTCCCLP